MIDINGASVEYLLNLDRLAVLYYQLPYRAGTDDMLDYNLQCLNVSLQVRDAVCLERVVPSSGPLLVLTNRLPCRIPELADNFIGVDVLYTNSANYKNNNNNRLYRHLKAGSALLVFPAGTLATIEFSHGRNPA